jgi:hypothetical protein
VDSSENLLIGVRERTLLLPLPLTLHKILLMLYDPGGIGPEIESVIEQTSFLLVPLPEYP